MDLSFQMRAERMLERHAAPAIEHSLLVASLSAHQAASATAKAARCGRYAGAGRPQPGDALAELLSAGPAWQDARRAQRGSFHPGFAGAAGKEK